MGRRHNHDTPLRRFPIGDLLRGLKNSRATPPPSLLVVLFSSLAPQILTMSSRVKSHDSNLWRSRARSRTAGASTLAARGLPSERFEETYGSNP